MPLALVFGKENEGKGYHLATQPCRRFNVTLSANLVGGWCTYKGYKQGHVDFTQDCPEAVDHRQQVQGHTPRLAEPIVDNGIPRFFSHSPSERGEMGKVAEARADVGDSAERVPHQGAAASRPEGQSSSRTPFI